MSQKQTALQTVARGMTELADAAAEAADAGATTKLLYEDDLPTIQKVEKLASEVYKAGRVDWGPMTRTTSRRFDDNGWNYPICMAKTHLVRVCRPQVARRADRPYSAHQGSAGPRRGQADRDAGWGHPHPSGPAIIPQRNWTSTSMNPPARSPGSWELDE